MKKGMLLIIVSFVLAVLPQIVNQFYFGIKLLMQIALSLIFPIVGLFLAIISLKETKKSSWKWGSIIAILVNVIVIIIILVLLLFFI